MSLGGRLDTNIQIKPNKLPVYLWYLVNYFRISLQVFAVGGAEPAADPEVQEAGGGTFSPTREAQLLDGHHRGGHAGHDQQTEISRTNTQRHKHSNMQTCMTRYSTFGTLTYHFTLQVLILEPTKIYQPSYVSINNEAEEKNVSIWHVSPAETVRMKHNIFYTWRRRKSWCAKTYYST